jgi:hypothetical protein
VRHSIAPRNGDFMQLVKVYGLVFKVIKIFRATLSLLFHYRNLITNQSWPNQRRRFFANPADMNLPNGLASARRADPGILLWKNSW